MRNLSSYWLAGLLLLTACAGAFAQAAAVPGELPATIDETAPPAAPDARAKYELTERSDSGGVAEAVLFYVFAAMVLGSGLAICISTNVVRMAVYLFVTLGSVAVLYFLLLANFIGVIQLIVYAGGTLILLIFGVMLTSKSPWVRFDVKRSEMIVAGVVCVLFAAILLAVVINADWDDTRQPVQAPAVADFGESLLQKYLVPFEAVSVLLLAVMIGAALLARQD